MMELRQQRWLRASPSNDLQLIALALHVCLSASAWMHGAHGCHKGLNYPQQTQCLRRSPLKTGVLSAPILQSISFSSASSKK